MFCFAILIVFRDIFIAFGSLSRLSAIITTSADSIAISEPIAPIAIPTSALTSEGASFIPSPTYTTAPSFDISSSFAYFSSGKRSEYTSFMPSLVATRVTFSRLSPERIMLFSTPSL